MIRVNIVKYFKPSALRLAFESQSNRIVIFGPSGSGKSMLLKLIAGFFQPDEGEIVVGQLPLFSSKDKINLPIHQRQIGYLPQEYTLFPNMTVRNNILYAAKARKLQVEPAAFASLIDRFGLESQLDDYPHMLSGGQKQRAALARLLLIKPRLMLLDEPFSALDTPIRESLRELVMEEVDRSNIPALFVTHDTEEAFVFGKEMVLVENRRVIETGPKKQLFDHPFYVETAQRLGFTNIWPVTKQEEDRIFINPGCSFTVNRAEARASFLCIRPENIMILREVSEKMIQERKNVLSGVMVKIHNRGKYLRLELKTDNNLHMNIHLPEHTYNRLELFEGKRIWVAVREELIILCRSIKDEQ